ncbi:hypothetical protein JCM16303_007297 [Sporobolomyces ruberrimus]
MSDTPRARLTARELREAAVLTVSGIKMQSRLRDYLPIAKTIGAGILVRDRLDTVSFVFRNTRESKLAYEELECGPTNRLLQSFAQWDLYIAVRPVARVTFGTIEPIDEPCYDETLRIYVKDKFNPAIERPESPEQTYHDTYRHVRTASGSSSLGSVGSTNSENYFGSPAGSPTSQGTQHRLCSATRLMMLV